MVLIGNFDATQVQPAAARDPIPAGWYKCIMVESEMKPTKNNAGAYLLATFEVIDGPYTKSRAFDQINLQNPNPVAVEIGYRTLSAICHAVGVMQVQDSAMLHNRPLQVNIKLRPAGLGADGKHYDASNEIGGYKAIGGAQTQAAPVVAPPPAAPVYQQPPVYTQPPAAQQPWQPQSPVYQQPPVPQAEPPKPWEQPLQAQVQPAATETPPWAQQPQG